MIVSEIYPGAREILGKSSQRVVFERITQAVQLLANAGDWDALIGFCDLNGFQSDARTFALPDDVETPMAINLCGRPAYMRNKWAEFHLNGVGSNSEVGWAWDDQGALPTIQDVIQPSTLLALADLKNDLFTQVRVFGYDGLGRFIRTQNIDGSWTDGFVVQPNLITDFPGQVIQENTARLFYRYFSAIPVTTLVSSVPHGFQTGVSVITTLVAGALPSPLVNAAVYFLSVVDPYTVQLYNLLSDSTSGTNVIQMTNVSPNTIIDLKDQREIQVQTKFTSPAALNFIQASAVTFSGTTLPSPILADETFYINLLDNEDFTIHATQADAEAGNNPLFVTTPGSNDLMANAQQPISPYTSLVFSVPHRFLQNDVVAVSNASGNLPTPLLPATNYYVRVINATTITLHTTLSDAASGANPIVMTDNGTGTSAVVKLVPATANVGSTNNINAPNSNLSPGDFVQFASSGNLPTPLLSGQVYVVTTPNSGNSFTIATPPVTNIQTSGRMRSNNVAIIVTAVPHGLVTGNAVNISGLGGVGYNLQQVTVTVLATNAFSYECVGANENVVASVSRCRSNEIATIVTAAPHGLTSGVYANIQNFGGSSYNQPWVQVTVLSTTAFWYNDIGINDVGFATTNRARASNVSTITTIAPHGLSNGQFVNIQGMTDLTFDNPYAQVTVTGSTTFTYANNGPDVSSTADAQGYVAIPQADGNGLIGTVLNDGAGVVSGNLVNLTDVGSGVLDVVISRAFVLGFFDEWFLDASNLTTGAAFQINTSGGLPATVPALSPTSTYYARVIDNFTAEFFVSKAKALDAAARLTASYSRTTNVATIVTQAPHGFNTGDVVEISFMTDSSFNTTPYLGVTVTVVNATTFTYANNGPNVASNPDTTGQIVFSPINIIAVGSGETDMILSRSVSVAVLNNLLEVSNASYMLDNTVYQFTTNGTLPAPLATGTNYQITVVNGLLQVADTSGNIIVLTNIGSGIHYITRDFDFTIGIPSGVQCIANEYNDGDEVVINQPGSVNLGTPPSPLVAGGVYYIRRMDDETVELYSTEAQAMDRASMNGLVYVTNSGTGLSSFFQILPAIKIQRVTRVLLVDGQSPAQAALPNTTLLGMEPPPLRNGYIDLYAWDYGREDNLTLLGHYSPNEKEPYYRRIKTVAKSPWIRMRYRRKTYQIRSLDDYIPLTSHMAILFMVRSQELYRANFSDEGQKYESLAIRYLEEEYNARNGPQSIGIQINDDIFTNSSAASMDSGRWFEGGGW
jgi:hypothetical protein